MPIPFSPYFLSDHLATDVRIANTYRDSTWDEIERILSSDLSPGMRSVPTVIGINHRIKELHDHGYDYAEIFVAVMQQAVSLASPHEISQPFRAAISSLLDNMRSTIGKNLNVR